MSDLAVLGASSSTFTFVSAAHGSTSWLDHCICNPSLHSRIHSISVNYDVSVTDHMPLDVHFLFQPSTLVPP